MISAKLHRRRVRHELEEVGLSWWGIHSSEAQHLPSVIHSDEHIEAAVYGLTKEGLVMLIATDKRVIYLDRKFIFTKVDEITYDVVSGVEYDDIGFCTGVTLHTRVNDFDVNWVSKTTAHRFARYIESRLEQTQGLSQY